MNTNQNLTPQRVKEKADILETNLYKMFFGRNLR